MRRRDTRTGDILICSHITNATATDSDGGFARGFTKTGRLRRVHEDRNYTRMYGGFADGFTTGSQTGSRQIHESSREFARVCESSREFARVRESSREFARVREGSRRMDSQRIYGGLAD